MFTWNYSIEENEMKKLNITKKQYDESKYFNTKYGALKFVSESGKLYKTDKGVVIALESKEDDEEGDEEPKGGDDEVKTPGEGEEEITVKKEDLATALQDVIDTVKDIAADNDVELPGEEKDDDGEEGDDDDDEVIPPDDDEGDDDLELGFVEDVCPTCGCKRGSCKKEDECTSECGGKKPALESRIRRMRRARMVREAAMRRARARKVLESIRRRRTAKKVLESIRRRRMAKKIMESRKVSPLARRIRMRKMMESVRPRGVRRLRRLAK